VRAAVLTVSDGVAQGERQDESGEELERLLAGAGYDIVRRVVADERSEIAEAIEELTEEVQLVLTTGGTGVAPRDVTPEATASVLERQVPGIAEALRVDAARRTPHGLLSRGVAGIRGSALVVNLPGSPGGCRDGFGVLREALPHALRLIAGEHGGHRQT
jgi:molybdopterin adenylyltransferase